MKVHFILKVWPLVIGCLLLFAAISFATIDVPVARFCAQFQLAGNVVSHGLSSIVLLTLAAMAIGTLLIIRLHSGKLSALNEAILISTVAAICTYALNDGVLKPFLGVPSPETVLHTGLKHQFQILNASNYIAGFPSGHMAMASAFAGVLMRLQPRWKWWLTALLSIGGLALIVGVWHFISDVLAGAAVGCTAGYLASELWLAHRAKNPTR